MGRYKLVALDMDGTVLNGANEISTENRRWIAAAARRGITVMFSTGRGISRIEPFVEQLGLRSPIVATNGGEVWKAPGQLHRRYLLEAALIDRMRELALQEGTKYWAYTTERLYNRDSWPQHIATEQAEWLKFGFYTEDADKLRRIRQQLEAWGGLEITNSHPCNLEINPKGVTKASGLREVCRLLGVEMSQVVAMGDSVNDIPMIAEAGLGVAMGNAQDEVKRIADVVTDSNEDHGVARAIEQYVLGDAI